jgi:hypothetical protein
VLAWQTKLGRLGVVDRATEGAVRVRDARELEDVEIEGRQRANAHGVSGIGGTRKPKPPVVLNRPPVPVRAVAGFAKR